MTVKLTQASYYSTDVKVTTNRTQTKDILLVTLHTQRNSLALYINFYVNMTKPNQYSLRLIPWNEEDANAYGVCVTTYGIDKLHIEFARELCQEWLKNKVEHKHIESKEWERVKQLFLDKILPDDTSLDSTPTQTLRKVLKKHCDSSATRLETGYDILSLNMNWRNLHFTVTQPTLVKWGNIGETFETVTRSWSIRYEETKKELVVTSSPTLNIKSIPWNLNTFIDFLADSNWEIEE